MTKRAAQTISLLLAGGVMLAGCGQGGQTAAPPPGNAAPTGFDDLLDRDQERETIWNLFGAQDDPNVNIAVSKYIWVATLDVLSFLPVRNADPFTGMIVTDYGVPPGGGRAYRATVHISDPALDARSLNLSLHTQGGGVASPETLRAVEDAILTRARQLRAVDARL
ncbi:MAG: DUF3576 domain-containing protein [Paracoccaceae bacterium]